MEGLDRCPENGEFSSQAFDLQHRLYGASPPNDFGHWCLERAVAVADTKPQVADHLLKEAVRAHKRQSANEGLSLEVLQEHTRKNEKLKTSLDRLLSLPAIPPEYLEYLEKDREHIEEQKRQEQQWLD